jgi:tetratricopeptide (TPR) repeat protein
MSKTIYLLIVISIALPVVVNSTEKLPNQELYKYLADWSENIVETDPQEVVDLLKDSAPKEDNISEKFYINYGKALKKLERYAEAADAFRNASIINPRRFKTFIRIAECFNLANDPESALEYISRAEEINPESYEVNANAGISYYLLGWIYGSKRHFDVALVAFEDALERNPSSKVLRQWRRKTIEQIESFD